MSYFSYTMTWTDGMQVTSTRLNQMLSGLRLAADSVDNTTVTLSGAGVVSVGVLSAANYGNASIPTAALQDGSINGTKIGNQAVEAANIALLTITGSLIAETTIGWSKTLTADRAVQADMQSESAAHFVSPDVLKYHPGVAKAYGRVSFASGSATITGGYNVASGADLGLSRRITLTNAMANTNYTVVANCNETGAPVNWTISSATQFILEGPGTEASGREISFAVYGQLA